MICPYCELDTGMNHAFGCPGNMSTIGATQFDIKKWLGSNRLDDAVIGIRKGDLRALCTNGLESLMRHIGEMGVPVEIRFDALRESNKFTIIVADEKKENSAGSYARRLCDTDELRKELERYLDELQKPENAR